MIFKNALLALATIFLVAFSSVLQAQNDAVGIVKKMDQTVAAIKDKSVTMKMVILNIKTKKAITKEAVLLQKGTNMKLFRYTAPPSDAGIATLACQTTKFMCICPCLKSPKKLPIWPRVAFLIRVILV